MPMIQRSRGGALMFCFCALLFLATPALGLDADGDGHPSGADCDDLDSQVWSIPGETADLRFDSDKATLSWDPPLDLGGTAASVKYDTLRSSLAYDFACDTAECTASDAPPTDSTDATVPPDWGVFYYVSRAQNACGAGTIGSRSNGAIRAALTKDCEDLCHLTNSGFDRELLGWILDGDCGNSQVIADDALHGNAFEFVNGGSGCTQQLWQVAVVDVDAQSSVRVRADVKLMYVPDGPVNLRVYVGVAPFYDQTPIGNHVFQPGSFAETSALDGTTTLPLGTWYAYTSDDIQSLIPAGTQFLRVELWIDSAFGRVDNVKIVLNDAAVPAVTASGDPTSGHPPLLVQFTGTCGDVDGVCVGTAWDFGDGTTIIFEPGGGGTSVALSPSYTFPESRTYHASLTVEDDRGAARSAFVMLAPENLAPTASIQVAPESGPSPLDVQFTGVATDDHLIVSYAWTFGDGGTSSAVNPMHSYTAAGTYLATLTVTDDHGATATAYHAVVATGLSALPNGDFADGTSGWVLPDCANSQVIADDALHGNAFEFINGGSGCTQRLWQVAVVDVDAQSSVRVRADVKLMYVPDGPVNLRVYAGVAPFYDQTPIGNHVFQPGSFAETSALDGTTTLPLGTWYAYTSDDIQSLIPAGTQFLRVELWIDSAFGRVDNVKIVLNDAAVPAVTASGDPTSGHPPLLVQFTGTCGDVDGVCVGTAWDFGDGTTIIFEPGGGGTSVALSPSYTFPESRTYHASLTVEDDRGAARSAFVMLAPENLAPTASIQVAPESGPSPLDVQFTGVATDDHLIVSYAWTFGDGGTSSAVNPMHSYTAAGTYLATLTVTDDHGATATAYHAVVATGLSALPNGDFADGTSGWVLPDCANSQVIADDALHGNAFEFINGGSGCTQRLWQVAVVDVDAQSSVRVRADVKLMYVPDGPVNLRVYAGVAPFYDQTPIGNHVFQPGSFAETSALDGTTTLPLGTWYAYTSDDIQSLIPAGTQFLRVELWIDSAFGRVDNVKIVLNDAAVPAGSFSANPTSGAPPLFVQFSSSCSDVDGVCVGTAWDFGDGTTIVFEPGGGTTSTSASPSNTFTGSRTYHVSLTVEDDRGAARSTLSSVSTTGNVPPTASIQAVPSSGDAPLDVQFTALASDSDGFIVSWAWDFGDGATSTTADPMHTYVQPGTFQVTLSVTDDQGAFTTAPYSTIVVTVP